MSDFHVSVFGDTELKALLHSVGGPEFMQAVAQAVYAEANVIMLASKLVVPIKDGPLRNSGTVNEPEIQGFSWWVTLGYGGAAAAYALIQHENLQFKHRPGRSAKYLENPVRDAMPILEKRIAARIIQFFSGKVQP